MPAWTDKFIYNRNANRETVRISTKITVSNIVISGLLTQAQSTILYSSTLTPQFNSKQGVRGVLRM